MKKTKPFLPFLTFLLIFNCAKQKEDFSFMFNLKETISENYDTDSIKINMLENENHVVLNISLEDSKFNYYSPENKQKIAREIGKLALQLRNKISQTDLKPIEMGELTFVDKSNFGIIKTSNSDSYKMH